MRKPLAIDMFCGLGGWTDGLIAEGYDVIGFDLERHAYGTHAYPAQLVLQDVRTLHGAQFKDATLIVASPPCQAYSYMAMPWTKAKAKAAWYRDPAHPERLTELNELFDACFRIQREASEAAGHRVPMVVENVCGAQPWVGRATWPYGSYYLWGDVPALMPITQHRSPGQKVSPGTLRSYSGSDGRKQPGIGGPRKNGKGDAWFQDGAARHGSRSSKRKAASALIAKIPFELARHIACCFAGMSAAGERRAEGDSGGTT